MYRVDVLDVVLQLKVEIPMQQRTRADLLADLVIPAGNMQRYMGSLYKQETVEWIL